MQHTLFHPCGKAIDVAEALEGRSNRFIFLDSITGDGLDRCPRCERALHIHQLTAQAPVAKFSRAKVAKRKASREARRLIAQARRVRKLKSAA